MVVTEKIVILFILIVYIIVGSASLFNKIVNHTNLSSMWPLALPVFNDNVEEKSYNFVH